MDPAGKEPSTSPLDAVLDAMGPGEADAMLAALLGDAAPGEPPATTPREIRARLKELAGRRPELIAKIITYWLNEERRKK